MNNGVHYTQTTTVPVTHSIYPGTFQFFCFPLDYEYECPAVCLEASYSYIFDGDPYYDQPNDYQQLSPDFTDGSCLGVGENCGYGTFWYWDGSYTFYIYDEIVVH